MKRVFITVLILLIGFVSFVPSVQAKQRVVTGVGNTGFISNGLYFKINEILISSKKVSVTVQAKNKSILSQAVYVELTDNKGVIYAPENKDSIVFFRPLKFNKPVTQKISFVVNGSGEKYWLAVYSKDIFKKNKKQMITKMSLDEAKKELNSK